MINKIIEDISFRLKINIDKNKINYFTDGSTDSIVFSIDNKYLIKTVDELTLKTQVEFFNLYKNDYFQKIIYYNEKLKYICFEYIQGNLFKNEKHIDYNDITTQIYNIVSNYKKYDYDNYGYLFEDHKSWYEFLKSEVEYSKKSIESLNIDISKVENALKIIKKYKVDKYLIHGDFGVHNFLINKSNIKVIDPMSVVGDYLYDFYFALLSSANIIKNIKIDDMLNFFDRNINYKKSLFIIVFYIRMCRCYIYDKDNFNVYLKTYNNL